MVIPLRDFQNRMKVMNHPRRNLSRYNIEAARNYERSHIHMSLSNYYVMFMFLSVNNATQLHLCESTKFINSIINGTIASSQEMNDLQF